MASHRQKKRNLLALHVLFWVIYILLWALKDLAFHNNFLGNIRTNILTGITYIPFVYFNLFYLMPRLLFKGKYWQYLSVVLPGILLMTLFSVFFHFWLFAEFYDGTKRVALFFISLEGQAVIISEIFMLITFSMTLYLLQQWYQKERLARELQKQKLETELNLLKSQVNPHFLFNALNSIFVMMDRDVKKSRNMIVQLSDVLSHQIYETQKGEVLLQTEVDNLKNYIEIERTRHGELADIQVSIQDNLNGHQIAPMLLLPIVENAFKHSKSNKGYWIKVKLGLSTHELHFEVENSNKKTSPSNGGIGLPNLRRQLRLLYPDKHQFLIENDHEHFAVNLKIELDDHPLSYS